MDPAAKPPRVSVIIPTYNRERYVGRCLQSLVAQTFQDFEVHVCDDGSRDGTAAIVDQFRDRLALSYHWNENFGGPARPRNVGIQHAQGEYVAFLDSDDWWLADKLAESVRCLDAGADFVFHDLYLASRANQRVFLRKSGSRELNVPVFADLMVNGNGINNSSVVVRKRLMQAISGFSEDRNLIAAEDFDGWLRIAQLTDAFVRIPRALGCYWVGDGNISNPARTLSTTEALEEKYRREIGALRASHAIYWPSYVKARANYLLRANRQALGNLSEFDWRRAPFAIRAKAAWMRALLSTRGANA